MYRILASCAAALAMGFASMAASAQTVGFASIPVGAINHLQTTIIAKVVQNHTDLKIRVLPMGGTSAIHAALNAGAAEFDVGDMPNVREGMKGGFGFPRPLPNLRVVLTYNVLLVGIMVRNDSGMKTMADFKGKRFPSGWPEFPNGIPLSNGLFATAGFSMKDTIGVPAAGLFPAADDFKVGKTDGTSIALVAPKVREINAAIPGGIRFLTMPNDAAAVKAIKSVRQDYKIVTVKPSPAFVGVFGPTNVLGSPSVIAAGAHVSDETVYKLVKAMAENKAELVKGHPSFRAFHPDKRMAAKYPGIPFHPGAIKYFKEKGYW